jgi:hypothetical protein
MGFLRTVFSAISMATTGNYQYYSMKADEFIQFAGAVQAIANQLSSMNQK